jgi:dolichol kinase
MRRIVEKGSRKMVELYFGEPTPFDVMLALFTGLAGGLILAIAYIIAERGVEHWKPRKLVHIGMGSIIALTAHAYATLSGPVLAAGIFLTILTYAWAHKSSLITELLIAGSRENESSSNTLASGFMGMIAFVVAFLFFFSRPEIFVAAILAVAWGDAAGEIVGRSVGGTISARRFRGKSVEGSFGVWAMTTVSILVAMLMYHSDVCPFCVLPQIAVIGVAIMSVELFSRGWTDNFVIPLATSVLMWLLIYPGMSLLF